MHPLLDHVIVSSRYVVTTYHFRLNYFLEILDINKRIKQYLLSLGTVRRLLLILDAYVSCNNLNVTSISSLFPSLLLDKLISLIFSQVSMYVGTICANLHHTAYSSYSISPTVLASIYSTGFFYFKGIFILVHKKGWLIFVIKFYRFVLIFITFIIPFFHFVSNTFTSS